jgi:osmotically inducible lipoprotein OsmB
MFTMRNLLSLSFAATVLLSACTGLSDTEQRVLTGAAAGGAVGTGIGAVGGNAGLGLAAGAVVGSTTAFMYDQHLKARARAYNDAREQLAREEAAREDAAIEAAALRAARAVAAEQALRQP